MRPGSSTSSPCGQPRLACAGAVGVVDARRAQTLVATGGSAARLGGFRLDDAGQIGGAVDVPGSPSGVIAALEVVRLDQAEFVFTSASGTSAITASRLLAAGQMQALGTTNLGAAGRGWTLPISRRSGSGRRPSCWRIGPAGRTSGLSRRRGGGAAAGGELGAAGGLGLSVPSALLVVRVAGVDYAVVAGAGSSSISLVALGRRRFGRPITCSTASTRGSRACRRWRRRRWATGRSSLQAGVIRGSRPSPCCPAGGLRCSARHAGGGRRARQHLGAGSRGARGLVELAAAGEGTGLTRLRFDPA